MARDQTRAMRSPFFINCMPFRPCLLIVVAEVEWGELIRRSSPTRGLSHRQSAGGDERPVDAMPRPSEHACSSNQEVKLEENAVKKVKKV